MSATSALLLIATVWVGIALAVAWTMARRGHDPFTWLALGVLLGPLVLPVAVGARRRRTGRGGHVLDPGAPGTGDIDVLAGIDGSREAATALATAVALLGPRIGRLTLVAVTHLDDSVAERDRDADLAAELSRQADAVRPLLTAGGAHPCHPELVLLPGRPTDALRRLAGAGGYDLLVVGNRGSGAAETVLGSVARGLAGGADVPVLLGGRRPARARPAPRPDVTARSTPGGPSVSHLAS